MATTTARRSHTVLTSTLAVGALLLAACSGGDDATADVSLASQADEPTTATLASVPVPTVSSNEAVADPEGTAPSSEPTAPEATAVTAAATTPDDTSAAATTPADTTSPDDTTAATTPATAPPATTPDDTTPDGTPAPGDGVDWTGIATDLLARHFEIPRQPSLDLVRAVCVEPSGCFDDAARTVEVLLGDGVRLVGGTPFDVTSVEFQGTADGAPVAESLAVNLLIRFVATDQGVVQLVDADGSVVSDVAPDDRFTPGQPASRAVILGRDSAGAGWKLVALSEWM